MIRRILLILLILSGIAQAEIINVPDDFETIQGAIDESANGDTILVESGEYIENLDFSGKDIVVIGSPDNPYMTLIDGDHNGSVVLFTNGESRNAVLSGFLLTYGSGNCVNMGGSDWYVGGAVFIQYASPTIENCIMLENSTENGGGGMFMWGSRTTPMIRKCKITENSGSFGGGLSIRDNCCPIFEDTEIIENDATNSGGGLYLDNNGGPTFIRCTFSGNNAAYGAGMSLWDSHPTFLNCTIADNRATWGDGGGICCMDDSDVIIKNCIFWDNDPHEINALGDANGHRLTFEFCDVKDGRDDIRGNDNGEIVWGDGNIDDDPLFVNAGREDYNLTEESPCIDAGDAAIEDDPDGTITDMGAYYFHQRDIDANPVEMDFGWVESGQSDSLMITILNIGRTELQISDQSIIPDDSPFTICQGGGGCEIEAESEHESWILFAPHELATYEATLRIESDDPDEEIIEIPITGSSDSLVSVRDDSDLTPVKFSIAGIYPNPFNSTTTISYSLPVTSQVKLTLYDITGREVEMLVDENRQAGIHTVNLKANNLPSGLYLVKLESLNKSQVRKMMLIK
ncbi:right-handed parallel beta-helix repeat-containing protein [bacterium]|nr:right-handed parallel beta-helix repeat-containing protein [bacterium]